MGIHTRHITALALVLFITCSLSLSQITGDPPGTDPTAPPDPTSSEHLLLGRHGPSRDRAK